MHRKLTRQIGRIATTESITFVIFDQNSHFRYKNELL